MVQATIPEGEMLLTLKESSTYLKCSRSTFYRILEEGKLTGYRLGGGKGTWRFKLGDLRRYVNAGVSFSSSKS